MAKKLDLTGQTFGELTAVQPTEQRKAGSVVWECICSCGKTFYAPASFLRYGSVTSCGHKRWPITPKGPKEGKDLTGKTFGELTVIKCTSERNSIGGILWGCRCSCGKICKFSTSSLLGGKALSCGHVRFSHSSSGSRQIDKPKKPLEKVWTLISPSGDEIVVRNLRKWATENAGLFGKPQNKRSATQIASGFGAIAQTLAGKESPAGKRRIARFYLGWTLKEPPKYVEGED